MKNNDQENLYNIFKDIDEEGDQLEQIMKEFDVQPSEDFKERSFSYALKGIEEARKKTRKEKIQRKTRRVKPVFGFIAAALLMSVTFFSTTEQGQAFISQVQQWFEPEKISQQEIEGMPEETEVDLHEGKGGSEQEADFIIYVDEERYQVEKENGLFRISVDLPERYPEVFMDITQQVDIKPEQAIEAIKEEITANYNNIGEIEQVEEPLKGYRISANNGYEWNDEKVVYYVVSNELGGSFTIKQQFFMEASEGHGVRLDNMLKDFTVITAKSEGVSN